MIRQVTINSGGPVPARSNLLFEGASDDVTTPMAVSISPGGAVSLPLATSADYATSAQTADSYPNPLANTNSQGVYASSAGTVTSPASSSSSTSSSLWTWIIAGLLLLGGLMAFGQSDNSIHVNQYPGITLGAKMAAAELGCNPNRAVPCYLILDASTAAYQQGIMPVLCSNCYVLDYRTWPLSSGLAGCSHSAAGYLLWSTNTSGGCGDSLADYGITLLHFFTFPDSFSVNAAASADGSDPGQGNFITQDLHAHQGGGQNFLAQSSDVATEQDCGQSGGVCIQSKSNAAFDGDEGAVMLDAELYSDLAPAEMANAAQVQIQTCNNSTASVAQNANTCNVNIDADYNNNVPTNGGANVRIRAGGNIMFQPGFAQEGGAPCATQWPVTQSTAGQFLVSDGDCPSQLTWGSAFPVSNAAIPGDGSAMAPRLRIGATAPTLSPVVFNGSGVNDASFSGGSTSDSDYLYCVLIDSVGASDTFSWGTSTNSPSAQCSNGGTNVTITGASQTLSNGLSVSFGSVTGHTLNDSWRETAFAGLSLDFLGIYGTEDFYIKSDSSVGDTLFFNVSHLKMSGKTCVTVAGSACTITEITNGCVTAATCTPE